MAPRIIVIAALGFALLGCVPESKYNALKLEKDQLVEAANAAETARAAADAQSKSYKDQLDAILGQSGNMGTLMAQYQAENKALREQYDDLMGRYNKLASAGPGTIGTPLPDDVANPLRQLALENSDILEFVPERGMIKFKSDVTFASGSAALTPQAKSVITRLAQILNSGRAANYELLVAGHTDNTRVVRPETIRDGHKDNWYLSAHRAITVSEELISHSVGAGRLGALGYADQRPIASNATTAGQGRNRRVELLLLPTTYRGGTSVVETAAPRTAPPAVRAPLPPNKDTVGTSTEAKPIFTK
jgi:chemotaxis protein MotB